jgi:hypothetical protein
MALQKETMKRQLHAYAGHYYMIINLLLISAAGFGHMSVQLSVEKGLLEQCMQNAGQLRGLADKAAYCTRSLSSLLVGIPTMAHSEL